LIHSTSTYAPFKPGDWVKQSIPFSYLSLTAIALDNSAHDMQVYSDIDGSTKIVLRSQYHSLTVVTEWISGDNDQFMYWNVTSNTDVFYHTITFSDPVLFSEIIDQAGWGTLYYATKMVSDNDSLHLITHSRWSRRAISHTQYPIGFLPSQIFGLMDPWTTRGVYPILPLTPMGPPLPSRVT
jgi:hypothetical protein